MKRITLFLAAIFVALSLSAQVTLLNEDFGSTDSASTGRPADQYDLDPVAGYLSSETVAINNYGQNKTSEGAYTGASGGNFFLLSNNWSQENVTLTWANMDVVNFSELSDISFGCAFSGGPNSAWLGAWMFSMQYSFDDVVNDPGNASWTNIDITGASGWPDPEIAGGELWSYVSVPVSINLNGQDRLSFRIKSNATADYHFDDLKLEVKTPTSGQERTIIGRETFGPGGYFRGPANTYENYSNGGVFSFSTDTVHYQNYGSTFTNDYEGNSNNGNWWITDKNKNEDTLVFTVNTLDYADVNLEFGFTYWGGVPGTMIGIRYTTDSIEWKPVQIIDPSTPYPGTNEKRLSDGYFHYIKYDDILPRAEILTIKVFQATDAQCIIDDVTVTGIYSSLSDVATLAEISFPGNTEISLEPGFSPEITSYTCELPPGTTQTPETQVTTTEGDAAVLIDAALDVTSEDADTRTTYIVVTAPDGETEMIYSIEFNVSTVGVARNSEKQVKVFPNPVVDQLQISANQRMRSVKLYNSVGSVVYFAEINSSSYSIDFADINRGVYFVEIMLYSGERSFMKVIR